MKAKANFRGATERHVSRVKTAEYIPSCRHVLYSFMGPITIGRYL